MSALPVEQGHSGLAAAELTVDLAAVAANTRLFALRAQGELMAVVKADGFGHGAVDVARTAIANGATWLGVTSVDEALALRGAGLTARLLSWLNPVSADFAAAVAADVDVAVPGLEHLSAVAHRSGPLAAPARVHLHLDTGLARDGAAPSLWPRLCRAARRLEQQGRVRVVGVMGHLPCADVPDDASNATGRLRFAWAVEVARAVGLRPAHRHLAATSATLLDPLAHHTLVRVGAGLVGIDPTVSIRAASSLCPTRPPGGALRPALTLTAPVVTVRRVRAGTPVGYGHTWSADRSTHLALLPVGYADGLPLSASHRAEVLVRGRRCPVVGRISMDQVVVDVGRDPVEVGEPVLVFGPGRAGEPTVREWADWAGTLEHELVTGIGPRVRRTIATEPLRALSGAR